MKDTSPLFLCLATRFPNLVRLSDQWRTESSPWIPLALRVSEACCHFLDWQQLLPGKPEFLVGTGAVCQGAVEDVVYPIASQIAVALVVAAGITAIDIQVGTANQPDQPLFWLGGPAS